MIVYYALQGSSRFLVTSLDEILIDNLTFLTQWQRCYFNSLLTSNLLSIFVVKSITSKRFHVFLSQQSQTSIHANFNEKSAGIPAVVGDGVVCLGDVVGISLGEGVASKTKTKVYNDQNSHSSLMF